MSNKDLSLLLRITIESGLDVAPWEEFHGYAEELLGHSIWTHEFADDSLWLDLRIAQALRDEGFRWQRQRMESPQESALRIWGEVKGQPAVGVEQDGIFIIVDVKKEDEG